MAGPCDKCEIRNATDIVGLCVLMIEMILKVAAEEDLKRRAEIAVDVTMQLQEVRNRVRSESAKFRTGATTATDTKRP